MNYKNTHRLQTLYLVLLGMLWSIVAYAQDVPYQVFQENTTLDYNTLIELRNEASLLDANLYDVVDQNIFKDMLNDPSSSISFVLPIESEGNLIVELKENKVVAANFRIRDANNKEIPLPDIRTFSGSIKNKNGSQVMLTLTGDNLKGIINYDGASYVFGKLTNHPQFIFYNGADMLTPNLVFTASDELNVPEELRKAKLGVNSSITGVGCKVLRVYFEVDYSLYNT